MNLTDKASISPQVVAREVGNETVLLDLASGTYFGLDPIGARMWQLLEEGRSLTDVCAIMFNEYDVPRDVLERDTLELAEQLLEKQLISVA